jgi:AhpC/TSA family
MRCTPFYCLLAALVIPSMARSQAINYPPGAVVADFMATDVDGTARSLYAYTAEGQYVMLYFFTAAGPSSQASAPAFAELYQSYGCNQHDLACLAVNGGFDDDAEVEAFWAEHGGGFPAPPSISADGGSAAVKAAFGIAGYPTFCYVGPSNIMANNQITPFLSYLNLVAGMGGSVQPSFCGAEAVREERFLDLAAFPVPTNDRLTLQGLEEGQAYSYTISDAQGVLWSTGASLPADMAQLALPVMPAGVYFLSIKSSAGLAGRVPFVVGP